ncbi:MAG: DNA polymerase I [Firmicutes bacterium]|nr:DNA polymerase I [Bacillota bacterium]
MDKIVIIDGNSLINRAYYAIQRPMITKDGMYTQGIYGFLSMLFKIRADYEPTHMLVAFDRKAPTFRHQQYVDYKAGRKGMPEELAMEMPVLKDILDAMGIARFETDGFEADDIIGTTARMAEEAGLKAFIITGDRDALQLATDRTSVIITKKGITEFKLYDDEAMKEEYGFDHEQFIDYKALRGDTSDNIPGIPGVGEKTAVKLIQQFGSLEELIRRLDEVENAKLRDKIEDGSASALMSKKLATIIKNVPVDYTIDDLKIKEQDTDKLIKIYSDLEFRVYLEKLRKEMNSRPDAEKAADGAAIAAEVEIPAIRPAALSDLEGIFASEWLIIDVLSDENHVGVPKLDKAEIIAENGCFTVGPSLEEAFIRAASGSKAKLHGFGLGRVYYYLAANCADISGFTTDFDCQLAAYLLSSSGKAPELPGLILQEFHVNLDDGPKQISMFETEEDGKASARKLAYIRELEKIQRTKIENAGLSKVLYNIELPLCKVLASMEKEGFDADREWLVSFGKTMKEYIKGLETEIYEIAGEKFNINSPQQLGVILFEKLGLPAGKKTAKGYSTSAEVLEKLKDSHPIIQKILEYRTYSKLNSTYVEGMLPLIAPDGRIHAHFQQAVTATGRLSCTEPNLQNIPVRTELGRQLRKAFIAGDEDHVLVGADYSQIELRVMAHMAGDSELIEAFSGGHDIHKETAAKVFNVPLEEVTPQLRSNAKAVNFGVIYGMSGFGLAEELTISRKQAEQYIKDYFERFKGVKAFMDAQVAEAKRIGSVRTLYGRRRTIPEIRSSQYMVRQLGERLAMNSPIQGTAADIIKIAMVKVYDALAEKYPESKLILQVHDELIIRARREDADGVTALLKECMEGAAELKVKLSVAENIADNWFDLK